ncbi:hypothetical protein [Rothia nasimurium]|uniref:hypothetical protein n=1 Tax=Rothia nasimurium TaxID=85336 RepID=UPI001F30D93D|nr:hypothetical protein [Rothia nasimurium]
MANNPYERLTAAIEEASDNPADKDWVQTAFATLATNGVKAVTSESAINRVIRQIAESGESATELYGSPQEWAAEKITTWREKGTQAFSEDEPWALKEVMVAGLFTGAFFSVLFWVVGILPSDRPSSQPLGFYFLPGALGMLVLAMGLIFQHSRKKLGFTAAVLLTALVILAGSAAIGLGLFASYEVFTQRLPSWTHLVAALGLGVLGTAAGFLLPSPPQVTGLDEEEDYQGDETWLARFKQELRGRGDISDARVREEISRVKEHAYESGSSYLEEFGHPVAYARSLSEQKKVKPYRLYLYSLMMIACLGFWGYGLWATPDSASLSWRLPLFIFVACVLVLELCKNYRTYRQAKK